MADETSWHLDKRVPVAIIITLVVQIAIGLMYFGALEQRVTALENFVLKIDDTQMRITRVEEQVKATKETTVRIEQKLDRALAAP